MKDLKEIGFYTLSDDRARRVNTWTDLKRCELILTDKCNFKCPYCRGLKLDQKGTIKEEDAIKIVRLWGEQGLESVRFSGGEPTIVEYLGRLVVHAKKSGIKNIAISTNGSADLSLYKRLIHNGVNDFSISLDGACCAVGDKMAGGLSGSWNKVVENIKALSKLTYVTVGMVFTEENVNDCVESVIFADGLGVSDIRVIPSAQYNKALSKLAKLPVSILSKYPILRYRIDRIKKEEHVRGIDDKNIKCWLALDDMAVCKGEHYPCIIYLREGGEPVGSTDEDFRKSRLEWIRNHNPYNDKICRKNCLDVCVAYNKKAGENHRFENEIMIVE